jgi:WD40 repeat protein
MSAARIKPFHVWRSLLLLLIGGLSAISGEVRGAEHKPRLDRYGTPLPKDALLRLGSSQFRVEGYIRSVAFSPDSKLIAASDSEDLVFLWQAATGKLVHRLDAGEPITKVLFSPDGKFLAGRSTQGRIQVWETASGKLLRSFRRGKSSPRWRELLLFTASGRQLIAVPEANKLIPVRDGRNWDGSVRGGPLPALSVDLLDATTGKTVRKLAKSKAQTVFSDAALSPDGKLLALGLRAYKDPDKVVHLIDVATGKRVRQIEGRGAGWFSSVAFTPDGKTLALGSCDEIVLANVASGKLAGRFNAPMGTVTFLAFAREKTLISHSQDNKVRLWNTATRKQRLTFDAEADGHDEFDLPGGAFQPRSTDEYFWKNERTALSPDGQTLAVGIDHGVRLWQAVTGKELFPELATTDEWAHALAFSPDGRLVLVNASGKAALWDARSGHLRKTLPSGIGEAAFSPDGKMLALAPYRKVKGRDAYTAILWDIDKGKELHRLVHPAEPRFCFSTFAFTPDGQNLHAVTAHETEADYKETTVVHQWEVATGKALGSVRRQETHGSDSAIASDGQAVASPANKGIVLFRVAPDEDMRTISGGAPEAWGPNSVFSADGQLLFIWTSGGSVSVWEIATGSVISRFCVHPGGNIALQKWPAKHDETSFSFPNLSDKGQSTIHALVVSPDGRFVATAETYENLLPTPRNGAQPGPAIRIWEATTGKEVQRLEGFRSRCDLLAFSPDGLRLASWFNNSTVLLWDIRQAARKAAATGKQLTARELNRLWTELAVADGARAYRALRALEAASDQAIALLTKHVRPVPLEEGKRVRQLVETLDSNKYKERQAATRELKALAGQFEILLHRAVEEDQTIEVERRLRQILVIPRQIPAETLRKLRSIQILERIGTKEARRILSDLARGEADARETRVAKLALKRLTQRQKTGTPR